MEELRGGGSYPICIVCCYSFPSPSSDSPQEGLDKREKVVDRFIQQTGVEDPKCLSSKGLLASEQVSICEDCLSVIAKAVERREQVEEMEVTVRQLQVEILRMMRQLGDLMEGYLEEMRDIETRIKGGDEACLRSKFVVSGGRRGEMGECTKKNVLLFRVGIVNLVSKLSAFRTDLSRKTTAGGVRSAETVNLADDFENSDSPTTCNKRKKGQPSSSRKLSRNSGSNQKGKQLVKIVVIKKKSKPGDTASATDSVKSKESYFPDSSTINNAATQDMIAFSSASQEKVRDDILFADDRMNIDALCSTEVNKNVSTMSTGNLPFIQGSHKRGLKNRIHKRVQCPHCLKWVTQPYFQHHLEIHLPPDQRSKVKCPDCGKLIKHLSQHQARFCPAKKPDWPFVCVHCSIRCAGTLSLSRHLKSVHGDKESGPKFPCSQCDLVFHGESQLKAHQGVHWPHQRKSRVTCESCGQTMKKYYYPAHVAGHCSGKEYSKKLVCHQCGNTFKNKATLHLHLQYSCVTVNANLQCKLCGKKGFRNDKLLARHEQRHKNNATRPFMCSLCGGNFNCSNHLIRHSKKCDGTKTPRKPRWSNMLPAVQSKPEEGHSHNSEEAPITSEIPN